MKKILLGLTGLLALSLLSACQKQSAQVIHLPLTSDLSTLDNAQATDVSSFYLIDNVQEGLTRLNQANEPEMALAQSITKSSDGLTYQIRLRPNLHWSNGQALTAQDFISSWQRALSPKTAAPYSYLLQDFTSFSAPSKNELRVSLTKPIPYFEDLLSLPITMPVNQQLVAKYGKAYGTSSDKTAYLGPFMLSKSSTWTGTTNSLTLVKNPYYWDKKAVKSDRLIFQKISNEQTAVALYKQGKLDVAWLDDPALISANHKTTGFVTKAQSATDFVIYNQNGSVKALNNLQIRQALNLATNRSGLVSVAKPTAQVATSFAPIGPQQSPVAQPYQYNPAAAKAQWQAGLRELGRKSLSLTLEAANDTADSRLSATYLQACWQKALPGLTINLKLVPSQQSLQDAGNQNFQLSLGSWYGDYPEASTFYQTLTQASSFNYGKFRSAAYDKAFLASQNATSRPARDAAYLKCEQILFSNAYLNPLDFPTQSFLKNPQLSGLTLYSTSGLDLKEAQLK